jgi:hypothetical protein
VILLDARYASLNWMNCSNKEQEEMEDTNLAAFIAALIVSVVAIVSMWLIFVKAGKPGWAAIIPIYNFIVLLEIVGRPTWWVLLAFVPFVNLIIVIIVYMDLARAFGKDGAYGCLMLLFPIIFIPLLAFSDARYQGPVAA